MALCRRLLFHSFREFRVPECVRIHEVKQRCSFQTDRKLAVWAYSKVIIRITTSLTIHRRIYLGSSPFNDVHVDAW